MLIRSAALLAIALLLVAGCREAPKKATAPSGPAGPMKPVAMFEDLPLSGNKATALAGGFAECQEAPKGVRCIRHEVLVMGMGPYEAAIDLPSDDGAFDHVTLWHDSDQGAILDIGDALKKDGWQHCLSGDFESYGRMGSPIQIVIDASYWGKRRAVISRSDKPFKPC